MSTKHISGIDALREALAATATSVEERSRAVVSEADKIREQAEADERNAQIAQRALRQQADDQLEPLDEEAHQLAGILGRRQPAPEPEPTPAPRRVIISGDPGLYDQDLDDESAPSAGPAPDPRDGRTRQQPRVVPRPPSPATRSNPNGQGILAFLVILLLPALVGLFVALLILAVTGDHRTLVWIGGLFTGFFSGALMGILFAVPFRRQRRW